MSKEYKKPRSVYKLLTICEVHRQVYDIIYLSKFEGRDKCLDLLEKGYLMGIKLIDKLAEYNLQYKFLSPNAGETERCDEAARLRELRLELQEKMANAVGNNLRPEKQQANQERI